MQYNGFDIITNPAVLPGEVMVCHWTRSLMMNPQDYGPFLSAARHIMSNHNPLFGLIAEQQSTLDEAIMKQLDAQMANQMISGNTISPGGIFQQGGPMQPKPVAQPTTAAAGVEVQDDTNSPRHLVPADSSSAQYIDKDDRITVFRVVRMKRSFNASGLDEFNIVPVIIGLNPPVNYKPANDSSALIGEPLLFSTEAKAREWVQAQVRRTFRARADDVLSELVRAGLEKGLLADADLDFADALRAYIGAK